MCQHMGPRLPPLQESTAFYLCIRSFTRQHPSSSTFSTPMVSDLCLTVHLNITFCFQLFTHSTTKRARIHEEQDRRDGCFSIHQKETRGLQIGLLGPMNHASFSIWFLFWTIHGPIRGWCIYTEKYMMSFEPSRHRKARRPLTFVFCQAHTLIAINEVPAGGCVQAWSGEALVIFLLTVEAVVTWGTERKACCQMYRIYNPRGTSQKGRQLGVFIRKYGINRWDFRS